MSNDNRSGLRELFEEMAVDLLEDEETRDEFLEATGHNPEQIKEEGRAFIKKVQAQARRRIARREASSLEELKEQALTKLREMYEAPKESLARLLAEQGSKLAGAHFRKLEELSEKDAIDMLKEIQVLELLEQLEEEEGEGSK